MPPSSYMLTHPDSRLTDAELAALADGLAATLGGEGGGEGGGSGFEIVDGVRIVAAVAAVQASPSRQPPATSET